MTTTIETIHFNDLLPSSINTDPQIQAISISVDEVLNEIKGDVKNVHIWSRIDELEEPLLSILAGQLSLSHEYAWQLAESLTAKRELIKNAYELHRYKGTPWSIRELVRLLGLGEIKIIEGLAIKKRAGSFLRDGMKTRGQKNGWAYYRIILLQAITNDQAQILKKAIIEYAPARSELLNLDFTAAAIRYNGIAIRNGEYNRGTV